jgi:hypothetical protein
MPDPDLPPPVDVQSERPRVSLNAVGAEARRAVELGRIGVTDYVGRPLPVTSPSTVLAMVEALEVAREGLVRIAAGLSEPKHEADSTILRVGRLIDFTEGDEQ